MRGRFHLPLICLATALVTVAPARAADETRNYRVNAAHDNAIPDSGLVPPLRPRWEVRIGHTVSNIVIADGRVFLVNHDNVKAELTALDAATGALVWKRDAGPGTRGWSLAYEGGRLFMSRVDWGHDDGGRIMAVAGDSGALAWEVKLTESYGISAPPTVDAGVLYAPASNGGNYLYALSTADGSQLWKSAFMHSGNDSSPTLDADSVYHAWGGGQVYSLARSSGAERWHYASCCTGGGGSTVVLHGGLLFHNADGNLVHDSATGRVVGSYLGYTGTGALPAFRGDLGLFVTNKLLAIGDNGAERWTYAPLDPYDSLAWPLIAGGTAYVREGDEFVTGVDLASGRPTWCAAFIPPPGSGTYPDNVVGTPHAGNGLLLVPIGYGLVAFESGGTSSGCPSAAGGPGSDPAGSGAGSSVALSLGSSRADLVIGQRTRLKGALTSGPSVSGRSVRIESDSFPFGRFRAAKTVKTGSGGSFSTVVAPRRNTRYRAVLADQPSVASAEITVYADFRAVIKRLGAGGPRPRLRFTLFAPKGAAVRRRPVVFYLATSRATKWRRVTRRPLRAAGRDRVLATARYPAGRLVRRDRTLVCIRERKPDAYGRPSPLDPLCGRATLPKARAAGSAGARR